MSLWNDCGGPKSDKSEEINWLRQQPDYVNDVSEKSSFPWGWVLLIALLLLAYVFS